MIQLKITEEPIATGKLEEFRSQPRPTKASQGCAKRTTPGGKMFDATMKHDAIPTMSALVQRAVQNEKEGEG